MPLGQPLKLARWYQDAIAMLTQCCIEGQPLGKMLELVRASAGAAGRVLPYDIIYEAGLRLDRDQRDLGQLIGTKTVARSEDQKRSPGGAVRGEPRN